MIYVLFFTGLAFKNQKMSGVTIIFLVQCQILNVSEIFNFCCSSEFNSSFERFLGELYGSLPNSAIQSEFIENEGFSDVEIDQMNLAKIRIKLRWRTKEDTTKWTIEKCIKVLKEHEGKRRAAVPAAAAAGGPAPGGPAAGGLASGPAAPVAAAPIYLIDSDEDSIDSDPILCVCKKTYTQKGGDMIACSSNNCKYGQWFHYKCIQLNKKQAKAMMEWYCMGCQYHSN